MNPQHSNLRSERAKLVGFCTLMLAAGAAFAVVAGPPRAPAAVPGLHDVLAMVSGSNVPLAPLALVLVDLAWLLWLWVFGSLCLEFLLAVAEAIGHGAAWVRSLRVVVDRVSAPLARKAVAAAFAMQVVSRGVPVAAAQTIDPGESALVSEVRSATSAPVPTVDGEISISTYRVQTGDTLWSIAERA